MRAPDGCYVWAKGLSKRRSVEKTYKTGIENATSHLISYLHFPFLYRKEEKFYFAKQIKSVSPQMGKIKRGTPALHLNEPKRIIYGSNELIADFLSQLLLFLDSLHPRL